MADICDGYRIDENNRKQRCESHVEIRIEVRRPKARRPGRKQTWARSNPDYYFHCGSRVCEAAVFEQIRAKNLRVIVEEPVHDPAFDRPAEVRMGDGVLKS